MNAQLVPDLGERPEHLLRHHAVCLNPPGRRPNELLVAADLRPHLSEQVLERRTDATLALGISHRPLDPLRAAMEEASLVHE